MSPAIQYYVVGLGELIFSCALAAELWYPIDHRSQLYHSRHVGGYFIVRPSRIMRVQNIAADRD